MTSNGIHKAMRMKPACIGKNAPSKDSEKEQERDGTGVKDILLLELVTQLSVDGRKANGRGKVDVGLDEGDDLGARFGCSDHQHILSITKDSVVE